MTVVDLGGIGPLTGNGWKRRMCLHQAWWRSERLGVPYGHGSDGPAKSNLYGNMLTHEDGLGGLNFVSYAAWAAYRAPTGSGKVVKRDRCQRNLLSSQPMAFNLFGPLTGHCPHCHEVISVQDVINI